MRMMAMCSTVWRLNLLFVAAFLFVIAGGTGAAARAGSLAESPSAYLAAHAEDAIAWQTWDGEALAGAGREDRLIFLTLGYAACHWCHVLARTTLKDAGVLAALDKDYVSILVDREERPDLDRHFSDAMLAMTGQSGYPALFVLTPDGVPVFSSGYLAATPEYGKPGLLEVLRGLTGMWRGERGALLANAETNRAWLRANATPDLSATEEDVAFDARADAVRQWRRAFDTVHGGFGHEPKFLRPDLLSFLLDEAVRRGDKELLRMTVFSLDHMAAGGVRDQLGGAFHRYAVDRFWQLPHFEIMLDENAWMALAYLRVYRATAAPRHAAVARGILDDLLHRFRLENGALAASLDAESGGEEGGYYLWAADGIRAALGAEQADDFIAAYLGERGILRLAAPPEKLVSVEEKYVAQREKLLRARETRVAPRRDDKLLTPSNAVALMAFADAVVILGDEKYLAAAKSILARLLPAYPEIEGLAHSRREGRESESRFLSDYAFLALALLHLFETDFDVSRLDTARALMTAALQKFQPEPGTPFRTVAGADADEIAARIDLDENGAPSANAAALEALYRLALFGAGGTFEEEARAISAGLAGYLRDNAAHATGLLAALNYAPGDAREIVIAGNPAGADTKALLHEVYTRPLTGIVIAIVSPNAPRDQADWPLLAGRPLLAERATAYVCKNRLCNLPVDNPQDLAAQLDELLGAVP